MSLSVPAVTIALPVFNAEKTLKKAILSIIDQSFTDWELLLLDDGSSDSSQIIARQVTDARVRVISDGVNRGISFRLNQAVQMARGRYFCRMDADDISFPGRIEAQLNFLEKYPLIDLVATSIVTLDSSGRPLGVVGVATHHAEICARPWNGFHFPHPTWFGRTEWFRRHAYSSAADGSEDQLLLYSTYEGSKFAGIPQVLLGYRDDRRTFGKMFGRRLSFWKAIGGHALRNRKLQDLVFLSIFQPAKIVADFLNIKLGIAVLRNKQVPPDRDLVEMCRKFDLNRE